jgi:hypothetical protein
MISSSSESWIPNRFAAARIFVRAPSLASALSKCVWFQRYTA